MEGTEVSLEELLRDSSQESLCAAAAHSGLSEDLALALLTSRDLPAAGVEALAKNAAVAKSRKVMLRIVAHPHAPRHVSLPILRRLFTFELMQVALAPSVFADLKRAAEDVLLVRKEMISPGERITLAKRGSSRIVGAMLVDDDPRIMQAALQNPRLTEREIIAGLVNVRTTRMLAQAILNNGAWVARHEVKRALLRSPYLSVEQAMRLAARISDRELKELLGASRLPESVKTELRRRRKLPGAEL